MEESRTLVIRRMARLRMLDRILRPGVLIFGVVISFVLSRVQPFIPWLLFPLMFLSVAGPIIWYVGWFKPSCPACGAGLTCATRYALGTLYGSACPSCGAPFREPKQ